VLSPLLPSGAETEYLADFSVLSILMTAQNKNRYSVFLGVGQRKNNTIESRSGNNKAIIIVIRCLGLFALQVIYTRSKKLYVSTLKSKYTERYLMILMSNKLKLTYKAVWIDKIIILNIYLCYLSGLALLDSRERICSWSEKNQHGHVGCPKTINWRHRTTLYTLSRCQL